MKNKRTFNTKKLISAEVSEAKEPNNEINHLLGRTWIKEEKKPFQLLKDVTKNY